MRNRLPSTTFGVVLAAVGVTFAIMILYPALYWHSDPPAGATTVGCAGAESSVGDAQRFRKAVLCLHNLERRKHGMGNLGWNRDLSVAAAKHARDMVRRHYFEHLSPGHRDLMDRIAAGGYKPTSGCWSAGENLFFSRAGSTPRQLVRAWMNSQAHRQNILTARWQDFGLGLVRTSPYGDSSGLTVVALFGVRSGRSCR